MDCAFDAAIAMHNKQIVIHGDDYRPLPGETYNTQKALERTYEFWAPYVEKAANQGVLVAIETVFEDNRSKNAPPDRFTSRLEELATLIDKFDNPYVKCCWDSGHARLAFGDDGIKSAIISLGKYLNKCLINDLHGV